MTSPVDDRTGAIDYDAALMLDAEELAERGVADACDKVSTALNELGFSPAAVGENVGTEAGTYTVQFGGTNYPIAGRRSHLA
jgi:hypothetical protein